MKDYSNYKTEINMTDYSAIFHFNQQLEQEGTYIKINNKESIDIDENEYKYRGIIRNSGTQNDDQDEFRIILFDKLLGIKRGDYATYLDDEYIIVSNIDKDNPYYNSTKLTLCNQTISWKDEKGKVYCYPCNIQNDSYGAKILLSNDAFGEVSQKCKVTIQNNKDTLKFLRPDFRFILSNSDTDIYKVGTRDIGIDSGIITLTCSKDVLKNEDDLENNIAYNGVANNETDDNDGEQTETTYVITGNTNLIKDKQQVYELNEEVQGVEWVLDEVSIEAELAEIISQDDKTCILSTSCGDGEPVTLSCYLNGKEMASIDLICTRK